MAHIIPPGGASANALIAEQALSSPVATLTFSSIPQTYRDLELTYMAASDVAATGAQLQIQFNGDAGANYDYEWGYGQATGAGALNAAAASFIYPGYVPGQTTAPNVAGSGRLLIPSYARTTYYKTLTGTTDYKTTPTQSMSAIVVTGWWHNTAAITSLTVFASAGNFLAGSVFTLRGIG